MKSKKSHVIVRKESLLKLSNVGPFDYINSVGVLHHLSEPENGLKSLASLLKKGGLLHLFLYADGGIPIKSLVQNSTVIPNFSNLLQNKCECIQFDFKKIDVVS